MEQDIDSDSRPAEENIYSQWREEGMEGWERYIWRQYLNPRPETTRKQEVGETVTHSITETRYIGTPVSAAFPWRQYSVADTRPE